METAVSLILQFVVSINLMSAIDSQLSSLSDRVLVSRTSKVNYLTEKLYDKSYKLPIGI